MKRASLALVVLAVFFVCVAAAVAQEKPSIDVSGGALNMVPLLGPEGIVLGPDGNLYVGEHDGKIRRVTLEGNVEPFADLNTLPGERNERISAIGLAIDKEGDIYAATLDFNDGSVLKVVGPGKEDAGTVTLYRRGIGMANFVLIDDESETMYVSNSSMFSGGVFRFDMKDAALVGTAADPEKELLGKFSYANGLALGPEKNWLYVAETTKGRISRVNLISKESAVFAEVGGWADGIAFNPERTILFVCDNKGGRIVAVDISGKIVGELYVSGREGQCAPASLVFLSPEIIVFTDLWKASLWRALLGNPQYHSYIYELPVEEIIR